MPQASAVWSADPAQMWTFPARFLVQFFDNHGMLGLARAPALAHDRRRLAPLRGGAHRAVRATGSGSSTPVARRQAPRRPRRGRRRAAASRALRRGRPRRHADQALALLADAARPRARDPRRVPVPAQRGGAAQRPPRCSRAAAAPGRAGTTTCSPSRRRAAVTYHMNRLQSLDADREFCVTLNRTEAIDPARHPRRSSYAHPVYTRGGARRPGAPRRDQRPPPHALLRRLLGLGLPRGRRRRAAARRASSFGGDAVTHSAVYEGTVRHRRFAVRRTSSPPRSRSPTSTSTSCRGCSAAGWSRAAPGSCASAARLPRRRRRSRSPTRARRRRRAPGRARRPGPGAHPPAHARALLQPGELLLLLRRRRRAARGRRRRGDEHAVGRAPRLRRCARRPGSAAIDKALHVSPFMGMDQRLRRRASRRPGATLSVHIESRARRRAALRRDAEPAAPRRSRAGACRRLAAHAAADLRPRRRPAAQGRPAPPASATQARDARVARRIVLALLPRIESAS